MQELSSNEKKAAAEATGSLSLELTWTPFFQDQWLREPDRVVVVKDVVKELDDKAGNVIVPSEKSELVQDVVEGTLQVSIFSAFGLKDVGTNGLADGRGTYVKIKSKIK